MLNKRNDIYANKPNTRYGDDTSYEKGIGFLDGHGLIVDWGCGPAHAKEFVKNSEYIGIDGSDNINADKKEDLRYYSAVTDCLFMRHVLEHNSDWRLILRNAINSFDKRMVLILFTPLSEKERLLYTDRRGIPVISLPWNEVEDHFLQFNWRCEVIRSHTQYHHEYIYYIKK